MLAMVGAMLFVVPALTAPRMVMRIFTTSEGSIELGGKVSSDRSFKLSVYCAYQCICGNASRYQ